MECNFEILLTISLWITCVKKTGLEVVESLFCFSLLPTLSKNNFGRLFLSRHSLLKAFMFLKTLYHWRNLPVYLIKVNDYKLCYQLHAQNCCFIFFLFSEKIKKFIRFFPVECVFCGLLKMSVHSLWSRD